MLTIAMIFASDWSKGHHQKKKPEGKRARTKCQQLDQSSRPFAVQTAFPLLSYTGLILSKKTNHIIQTLLSLPEYKCVVRTIESAGCDCFVYIGLCMASNVSALTCIIKGYTINLNWQTSLVFLIVIDCLRFVCHLLHDIHTDVPVCHLLKIIVFFVQRICICNK